MATSFEAESARLAVLPPRAAIRFADIIKWARKQLDDAIDAAGVDKIIAQANVLYDKYVAPVNIPWVPDILEPTLIDAPAKQLLAAIIRGFHDLIHEDS